MTLSVLYAWEFGANLGHVGTFLPVARALRTRGHAVHWVVAHPDQAARLLPGDNFAWLQAPNIAERRREGPPLNYADILLRFGYANPTDLLGLVIAWRELLRLTGAQVVLADHAPTAILAARTLDLPVMMFGGGFFMPPAVHPTPNMRPWIPVPGEHLLQNDIQVLASINAVLARFDRPPLATLSELFRVAEDSLLTFPELDHYENRGPAKYWGTLPAAVAAPPEWPVAAGRRIFAYLRPNSAHFEAALQALRDLAAAVLIYAPGAPAQIIERFSAPHLKFSCEPVDLNTVARQADAAVTYASPAATIAFLMAGKPALMIPGHLEQFLLARRVEQMGAGLLIDPEKPPHDLGSKLQRILESPEYLGNARAFAQKYAAFPQETIAANLVRRIEEIAA